MCARLYPLLTEDIVQCFNGSEIKPRELIFSKKTHHNLSTLA
jgi:hypothetical protein